MSKAVRVITCIVSGLEFPYSGKGRPPKYHPSVRSEVLKSQRKTSRDSKKVAKA